jgi:hypothetical protein
MHCRHHSDRACEHPLRCETHGCQDQAAGQTSYHVQMVAGRLSSLNDAATVVLAEVQLLLADQDHPRLREGIAMWIERNDSLNFAVRDLISATQAGSP